MPFTFSHPAIVLPLNAFAKKWVSLTGLVIGSIAPDFEYFISMKGKKEFSHSLGGIFWFDLPLALFLCFLFHLVVRDVLINHLPAFLQRRLFIYKSFSWSAWFKQHWFIVISSIIAGSLSHLFWDGFTNSEGLFVKQIPLLQHSFYMDGYIFQVRAVVHYLFSVLGLLACFYAIWQLPTHHVAINKTIGTYWLYFDSIALCILTLVFAITVKEYMIEFWVDFISRFIIILIAAFIWSLVITSFIYKLKTAK